MTQVGGLKEVQSFNQEGYFQHDEKGSDGSERNQVQLVVTQVFVMSDTIENIWKWNGNIILFLISNLLDKGMGGSPLIMVLTSVVEHTFTIDE